MASRHSAAQINQQAESHNNASLHDSLRTKPTTILPWVVGKVPNDAVQKAFYYVRVIEIPTPRWSTYDAFRFGVQIPDGAPVSTQERAYTSPIWYTL